MENLHAHRPKSAEITMQTLATDDERCMLLPVRTQSYRSLRSFCVRVLSIDGKYKLHHGKMILISIGTHHFRWDSDRQELTHQYVPLVYLMCKQIESAGATAYLCSGADHIAQKYYGKRLLPGIGLLDHCEGFMAGYKSVWPDMPVAQCWPHISCKFRKGEYASKKWRHFEVLNL